MTSKRVLTGIPTLFVFTVLAACSGDGSGGGGATPRTQHFTSGTTIGSAAVNDNYNFSALDTRLVTLEGVNAGGGIAGLEGLVRDPSGTGQEYFSWG